MTWLAEWLCDCNAASDAVQEVLATISPSVLHRLLHSRKHPHRCLERLPRPLLEARLLEALGKALLPQRSARQRLHLAHRQPRSAFLVLERHSASMPRLLLPLARPPCLLSLSAALLPRELQLLLCSASLRQLLDLAQTQLRHSAEAVRACLLASIPGTGCVPRQDIVRCLHRVIWRRCQQACLRVGDASIWSRSGSICSELAVPLRRNAGAGDAGRGDWLQQSLRWRRRSECAYVQLPDVGPEPALRDDAPVTSSRLPLFKCSQCCSNSRHARNEHRISDVSLRFVHRRRNKPLWYPPCSTTGGAKSGRA